MKLNLKLFVAVIGFGATWMSPAQACGTEGTSVLISVVGNGVAENEHDAQVNAWTDAYTKIDAMGASIDHTKLNICPKKCHPESGGTRCWYGSATILNFIESGNDHLPSFMEVCLDSGLSLAECSDMLEDEKRTYWWAMAHLSENWICKQECIEGDPE